MTKLPRQSQDLTGERYGKLIAVAFSHSDKGCWWNVRCDCGEERIMSAGSLKRSRSCGCSHKERALRITSERGYEPLWKRVLTAYKNNARQRGITWQIADATFLRLAVEPCHYCGAPPSNVMHNGKHVHHYVTYSGLDRIDNEIGYEDGNVVPCCKTCNLAKRGMTAEEFLGWAQRIATFQGFR